MIYFLLLKNYTSPPIHSPSCQIFFKRLDLSQSQTTQIPFIKISTLATIAIPTTKAQLPLILLRINQNPTLVSIRTTHIDKSISSRRKFYIGVDSKSQMCQEENYFAYFIYFFLLFVKI